MLGEDDIIIDVGAGGRQITPKTMSIDFIPFENTDLVCDLHSINFKDNTLDCIFLHGNF
jgi:predicted SAM-dependent methyltransferase